MIMTYRLTNVTSSTGCLITTIKPRVILFYILGCLRPIYIYFRITITKLLDLAVKGDNTATNP